MTRQDAVVRFLAAYVTPELRATAGTALDIMLDLFEIRAQRKVVAEMTTELVTMVDEANS